MRTRMDGVHHKHRNISSAYLYETDARLYIKQRSQSSVLVKQAKKNSFSLKCCHQFAHRTSFVHVLYLE